ncbi:MAG: LacI family DNA-binding transcriptional regulator [Paracoccaceae bacterium]|nr:LacI family DNA-binding transcriptional regulator [Paracoccaceae bacterium]
MPLTEDRAVQATRVTISDVADAAGVTKGTVSRALNDYPDISEATRTRVLRKAKQMGYQPLAQAQAIKTGRTRTIGLVLQTDIPGAQRPFLSDFLAGLSQTASDASWTMTVATSAGGQEMLTTIKRLVQERKADGFILPRTFANDERVTLLRTLKVPYVLYGRLQDIQDSAWFDILGEEAMRDAVLRLAQHGHQRIGFVNGGSEYNFSRLRAAGFENGMNEARLDIDESLITGDAMTREQGTAATLGMLARSLPPTAIVFAVDMAALGAYDAAEKHGLVIGQDLSLISYDGIPECQWVRPQLTSFRVDSQMAGSRLASLLIRQIRGEDPTTLRESAKAMLWPGGSDGPPRRSPIEIARIVRSGQEHNSCETGGTA